MLLWLVVLITSFAMLVDGIRRLWTYSDESLMLKGFPLAALELYGVFLPSAVWSTHKLQGLYPQFLWKLWLIITMAILVFSTIIYATKQKRITKQGGSPCRCCTPS